MTLIHRGKMLRYQASNVKFLLNGISNNWWERTRDEREYFRYIPDNRIPGRLGKGAAIKRLRENDDDPFVTPPTPVNKLAREFFRLVNSELNIN